MIPDETLLARLADGDRDALGELVSRHQARILRYARSLTRTPEQAEDALQQAFVDALRGAGTWSGKGSVRGWLLTLTRHAAFRQARRRVGEPEHFVPLAELGVAAGWGADPETALDQALAVGRLRAAIDDLNPQSREVLVLRDLEGLSGADTAELLGVGLAAMKSRLHRARLELAARLREEVPDGP